MFFTYEIVPQYVNPYLERIYNQPPLAPTGISSFGLMNNSGKITPYTVEGSSMVGFAQITSMSANNPNVQAPIQPDEVSLQLNAILQITNNDNSTYVYWPQNVPDFLTNSQTVTLANNVLNMTGDDAYLTNQTIQSNNGFVVGYQNGGSLQTYYGDYAKQQTAHYNLPFAFVLYLNETVQQNTGVWIYMGIQVLQNGTAVNSTIDWYDKILIVDPNVVSASYVVSGDKYTPAGANSELGHFYDTELVFCGGGNGASAHFNSLNAALSLYYYNQTLKAFPSVYTFGADTAETTDNVQVALSGEYATLTAGTQNQQLLTNGYSSSLPDVEKQLIHSEPPSSNLLPYIIIAIVVIALAAVLLMRRRKKPAAVAVVSTVAASAPATPSPGLQQAFCPSCGSPLTFVPENGRWFCNNCNAYQEV